MHGLFEINVVFDNICIILYETEDQIYITFGRSCFN